MTLEACRRWRELLGAYLLGQIGFEERAGLEAHLDGCAECRAELAELRPVAGALDAADPTHLGSPPSPPAELADRVFAHVHTARRKERRRRWAFRVGAGIAAAAVALSVAIALKPEPRVEREVFAFKTIPAGVIAQATLYHRPEGVEVWLQVKGLTPGATYAVWVERAAGQRVPLGTFNAIAGNAHVVLPSTVQRLDATAVGVSDTEGHIVLRAPITPPRSA